MKRTITLVLIVLIAFATLLTSCAAPTATTAPTNAATAGPTEPPKPATVTFANFTASGDMQANLDKMQAEFKKQYDYITLESETIAYGDYFTQIQTRVAAGTAPDCYELNYENFVSYAKKGVLLDLAGVIASTGFDKTVMNEKALGAFSTDGVQYGLPDSFSNVVLIYNKKLFDQAGVAYPTADWKWADEQAAAEKIRALGADVFGISHPIQFWEFFKVVQQNGGSVLSADKKTFTVNSAANVATLQFMVDRVLKSNVMPNEKQFAGMGDWDMFKAGKLGMIVTGVWAFSDFAKNITSFEWDIAIEPGNTAKATHFFSNGIVVNKDTKVADAAFQWVRFACSSKEAAQIRIDASWELPAVTYPDVLAGYLKVTPPASRQVVFDTLNFLITPPVIEQFAEMGDIIGAELTAAASGAKTAQQALDDAQKSLEEKIKLS